MTLFIDPFVSDPFREMQRMQRDVNRLLNVFGYQTQAPRLTTGTSAALPQGAQGQQQQMWVPNMDLYELDDHLEAYLELPGVTKDSVNIEYTGKKLIIHGHKQRWGPSEHSRQLECDFGEFRRRIKLWKTPIDESKIQANFENGILKLVIPKPEQQRPKSAKKINIEERLAQESKVNVQRPSEFQQQSKEDLVPTGVFAPEKFIPQTTEVQQEKPLEKAFEKPVTEMKEQQPLTGEKKEQGFTEGLSMEQPIKSTELPLKSTEQFTEKPSEKLTEKPSEKFTEKPSEKFTEKPSEKVTESTGIPKAYLPPKSDI